MEQITQQERALNRTVDQIVDASLPQPQEVSVEKLGRSRSAENTNTERRSARVRTLKTEPCISQRRLATTSRK